MLTTIRNAWKIPELRRKLLFTLVIILLYRIGNVIPVPGVNVQQMSLMFSQQLSNTIRLCLLAGHHLRTVDSAVYQRVHHHSASYHRHSCS